MCLLSKVERPAKYRCFRLEERNGEGWCGSVLSCSFIYLTYFYLFHHTAIHLWMESVHWDTLPKIFIFLAVCSGYAVQLFLELQLGWFLIANCWRNSIIILCRHFKTSMRAQPLIGKKMLSPPPSIQFLIQIKHRELSFTICLSFCSSLHSPSITFTWNMKRQYPLCVCTEA